MTVRTGMAMDCCDWSRLLETRLWVERGDPLSGEVEGGSPTNLTLFMVNMPGLDTFPRSGSVEDTGLATV